MNKAAKWLIEKRKYKNLSLRELGRLVGLPHTTIAKAENGQASFETWNALAEYFEESPRLVLSWAEKMELEEGEDPWVVDIRKKLSQLSPELRNTAEVIIEALYKNEKKGSGKK